LDAALEITDSAARAAAYRKALDLWGADLPLIPLVQADQITVLNRRVEGYVLSPSGNHFFGPVYWQAAQP
jgi:ABC-type transport system substrate-binding protein